MTKTKKRKGQPDQFHTLTREERKRYRQLDRDSKTVRERIGPVYESSTSFGCQVHPGKGYKEFNRLLSEMSKLSKLAVERVGCFVFCEVENYMGSLMVTFEDGSSLLLQSDWDQASFCDSCGLFSKRTPDGEDSVHNPDWPDCDPTSIWYCPDEYLDQADPPDEPEDEDDLDDFDEGDDE